MLEALSTEIELHKDISFRITAPSSNQNSFMNS